MSTLAITPLGSVAAKARRNVIHKNDLPHSAKVVFLEDFRSERKTDVEDRARRADVVTSLYFRITRGEDVFSSPSMVDPSHAIAVIAWCLEIASQMVDLHCERA